jgi:hypothetical protein
LFQEIGCLPQLLGDLAIRFDDHVVHRMLSGKRIFTPPALDSVIVGLALPGCRGNSHCLPGSGWIAGGGEWLAPTAAGSRPDTRRVG